MAAPVAWDHVPKPGLKVLALPKLVPVARPFTVTPSMGATVIDISPMIAFTEEAIPLVVAMVWNISPN